MGASIRCKSFHRVNAPNVAPREMRKIVIICMMVFYNAELPEQDVCYILVPRYVLSYVIQPAQMVSKHTKTDSEIQKPLLRKAEFANRRFAICDFVILDLQSRTANRRFVSNHKSSVRDPRSLILEIRYSTFSAPIRYRHASGFAFFS